MNFRIATRRLGDYSLRTVKDSRSKHYQNTEMRQLISSSHRVSGLVWKCTFRCDARLPYDANHDLFSEQIVATRTPRLCDIGRCPVMCSIDKVTEITKLVRSGRIVASPSQAFRLTVLRARQRRSREIRCGCTKSTEGVQVGVQKVPT